MRESRALGGGGIFAWSLDSRSSTSTTPATCPAPSNINVVQAQVGARFSVGVHYFSGSEPTPAIVRVYCGGEVVFESECVVLTGGAGGPLWRVGDLAVGADGRSCTFARCGRPGAVAECIRPSNER